MCPHSTCGLRQLAAATWRRSRERGADAALCLQAARQRAAEHRAAFEREARRRRRPFALIWAALAILVVLNIALWVSFGRSVASGGYDARARVALLLVPAVMLVAVVIFLRRRILAAAAMTELPVAFSNGGRLPRVTRVVLHTPRRPGTAPPLGQQRHLAWTVNPVAPPARGVEAGAGFRQLGAAGASMPIRIV